MDSCILFPSLNKLENKKVLDVSEAFVSTWVLVRAHYNHCADRFSSSSKYLHQLNIRQQELSDNFALMYSKPDERRVELLSAMDEIIVRVEAHVRAQCPSAMQDAKAIGTMSSSLVSDLESSQTGPKIEDVEQTSTFSRIGSLIGFGARQSEGNRYSSSRRIWKFGMSSPLLVFSIILFL